MIVRLQLIYILKGLVSLILDCTVTPIPDTPSTFVKAEPLSIKIEPHSPKEASKSNSSYPERLKTALKRPSIHIETLHYPSLTGNNAKRMKTSPQLSPVEQLASATMVVAPSYQKRSLIMTDTKVSQKFSVYGKINFANYLFPHFSINEI